MLVLGHRLDRASSTFESFEAGQDAIRQMVLREEPAYLPQHRKKLGMIRKRAAAPKTQLTAETFP